MENRNLILLRGKFVHKTFSGNRVARFIFRDEDYGWRTVSIVKEKPFYEKIKINEQCEIYVSVEGKLKKSFREEYTCFNDFHVERLEMA
ncbi:hypothetical protein LZ578_08290 [Jeotgalibaca sp. MA1X17-3]|uniref:hypothetical protein n=1 Tax=Jeotgalibaca sp. MA1X17-3 TaxID=2908211 RepID=UPI001F1BD16F|nr:hypothetical protein [Jeotgalibaca sp. MA1X17-3]UJF15005.1 hypothetical protein LZ578_08290 [Jeotgalibaca sp. MA1X17-3]